MKPKKSVSKRNGNLYAYLIKSCLAGIFVLTPLFSTLSTYQGIHFDKVFFVAALAIIAVVAWALKGLLSGVFDWRKTTLGKPLVAFGILTIASLIFAQDAYHAFFGSFVQPGPSVVIIISLILIYFLSVTYLNKNVIAKFFLGYVIISTLLALWFLLGVYNLLPSGLPLNTIGSVGSLVLYSTLSLPFVIVFWNEKLQQLSSQLSTRVRFGFMTAALVINVLLVFSLFPYVAWGILLLALVSLLLFNGRSGLMGKKTIGLVLALVVLTICFVFFGDKVRLLSAPLPAEASLTYSQSWSVAKDALRNAPIIGTGISSYGAQFSQYRPEALTQVYAPNLRFTSPTGLFFGALTTIGILGTFFVTVLFLAILYSVLKPLLSKKKDLDSTMLGLGSASTVIIVAFFTVRVETSLIIIGTLSIILYFAYIYDYIFPTKTLKEKTCILSEKYSSAATMIIAAITIGLVAVFFMLSKNFLADTALFSTARAFNANDSQDLIEQSQKTLRLNDADGRYHAILAELFISQANREAIKSEGERNNDLIGELVQASVQSSNAAVDLLSHDAFAHELRGFIHENSGGFIEGALAEAEKSYSRAKELEPANVTYDVSRARIHLALIATLPEGEERTAQARTILEESKAMIENAISVKSNYAPAYDALSQIEEALGNQDAAIYSGAQALQYNQTDFNYNFRLSQLLQVRAGENDLAIAERLLVRILGVNDQNINARVALGIVYERAGKPDLAQEEYQLILENIEDKESPTAKAINTLVDTLREGGSNVVNAPSGAEKSDDKVAEETDASLLSDVSIAILDGGSENGAVGRVSESLQKYGMTSPVIGTARDDNYEGVRIFYGNLSDEKSQNVVKILEKDGYVNIQRVENEVVTSARAVDVVVVVGNDIAPVDTEETVPSEN